MTVKLNNEKTFNGSDIRIKIFKSSNSGLDNSVNKWLEKNNNEIISINTTSNQNGTYETAVVVTVVYKIKDK